MMQRFLLIATVCAMVGAQPAWPQETSSISDPCKPFLTAGCGHLFGNVYRNDYFAVSYGFPRDWAVMRPDEIVRRHRQKVDKLRADAFRQAPKKQPYVMDSWDLLIATNGTQADEDYSNLVLWADELGADVHTLADYPDSSAFLREASAEALKQPETVTLAGRAFLRMDRRDTRDGAKVYHTRLVTLIGGYALGFDLYAGSPSSLLGLVKTTENLRFSPRPDTGALAGSVYHNDFFGFAYELPQGFVPQDDYTLRVGELKERVDQTNAAPALSNVDVLLLPGYPLVVALRTSARTEGRRSMVHIYAEAPYPLVTTAREHLEIRVVGRAKREGFNKVSKPREVKVGGRDSFVRTDRSGTISGEPIYETWVMTLEKGVVLQFEFAAGSQAELDEIVKSLESVRFDSETAPPQKP